MLMKFLFNTVFKFQNICNLIDHILHRSNSPFYLIIENFIHLIDIASSFLFVWLIVLFLSFNCSNYNCNVRIFAEFIATIQFVLIIGVFVCVCGCVCECVCPRGSVCVKEIVCVRERECLRVCAVYFNVYHNQLDNVLSIFFVRFRFFVDVNFFLLLKNTVKLRF